MPARHPRPTTATQASASISHNIICASSTNSARAHRADQPALRAEQTSCRIAPQAMRRGNEAKCDAIAGTARKRFSQYRSSHT
jgi:hypothetical protein